MIERALRGLRHPEEWRFRYIPSLRHRDDGCTHSHESWDVVLDEDYVGRLANGHLCVPLRLVAKGIQWHRVSTSVSGETAAPLVHVSEIAEMARAHLDAEWKRVAPDVPGPSSTLLDATAIIVVADPNEAHGAADAMRREIAHLADNLTPEQIEGFEREVRWLEANFADNGLIAVEVPSTRIGDRVIIKLTHGKGSAESERRRGFVRRLQDRRENAKGPHTVSALRGALEKGGALERTPTGGRRFGSADADLAAARSTHLQIEAPAGTVVTVLRTYSMRPSPAGGRRTEVSVARAADLPQRVATIANRQKNAEWPAKYFEWVIQPESGHLTTVAKWGPLLAWAMVSTIAVIATLSHGCAEPWDIVARQSWCSASALTFTDLGRLGGSISLLLAITSLFVGWAGKDREHVLAAQLLRPYRRLVLLTSVALWAEAALLATLDLAWAWNMHVVMTVAMTGLLVRSIVIGRSVVRRREMGTDLRHESVGAQV